MATTASMPAYMLPGVPVHQPPHLEGDASLATEILPGPPSLVSAQQAAQKRDPRKPSTVYSYLPHSDPGSTYSGIMHGTLIGQEPEGPRTKRSRVDKGRTAAGRAQRASARSQNGVMSALDPTAGSEIGSSSTLPPVVEVDTLTMVLDDDPSLSRSNSSFNMLDDPVPMASGSGRLRRKDKGKGKEAESTPVRVKEEPKTISLHSPELAMNLLSNDDHCSSCRSHGALVYCDGCPRAFHLWCLDPPMEGIDEGDSRWFCPNCMIRTHPPKKPPPSLLSPLIYQLETSTPVEFQLPDDVRTFFKDVATGTRGTYIDSSEIKQLRLNRHGQLEDRDPHRLRDRNGSPVLCFKCGMSALPGGLAATAPATKRARRSSSKATTLDAWKSIVSCDYCNLHWHLDCLESPLSAMPSYSKKWMCPNHAERVLPLKRRIPKQNIPPIEITKPKQYNNGNIELSHPEISPTTQNGRVSVDEVLINGRRYRVPEQIIVLDFWSKLNKNVQVTEKENQLASGMSSPLTSLTSLDDLDDRIFPDPDPVLDDSEVVQILTDLRSSKAHISPSSPPSSAGISSGNQENSTGTRFASDQMPQTRNKAVQAPKAVKTIKRSSVKAPAANGASLSSTAILSESVSTSAITSTVPAISTAKRKRASQNVHVETSTRELRSRSRNTNHDAAFATTVSSKGSLKRMDESGKGRINADITMSAPILLPPSVGKLKPVNVKLEETDTNIGLINGSIEAGSSSASSKIITRRTRVPRRASQKEPELSRKDTRDKRGKKRKEREEEVVEVGKGHRVDASERLDKKEREERKEKVDREREKQEKEKRKNYNTPARHGHPAQHNNTTPASSIRSAPPVSTTPSLKIRLPRLSNIGMQNTGHVPGSNGETPSRL